VQKNILLCVSGGIAVFKAAALTSKLTQAGANVKVIMTESAKKFVTPLTFQALSRNDVYTVTFDEKDSALISHIDLADWADIVLIAPATANVIGKLASGIADDMLTTTVLASTADIWVAPAMNVHMYDHPAVKANLKTLHSFGYRFIEPGEGQLACGYVGKGRLAEPEDIVELLTEAYQEQTLKNQHYVITAGPTEEVLDPVRYFTNRSSGKMGYALAEVAKNLGATVSLITGPTSLTTPNGVDVYQVRSAEEMFHTAENLFPKANVFISAAAVADYRPKEISAQKIKKKPGNWAIEMERTVDIIATLGKQKDKQFVVGFAAESENVEQNARQKIEKKNLDMIVANNITTEGAGFQGDTNIVSIYKRDGSVNHLPLLSKQNTAKEILKTISELTQENEQ
jgi:phosphopantothenoylcysteine decarboxylase / phosphopantothenate---cysteine ligase